MGRERTSLFKFLALGLVALSPLLLLVERGRIESWFVQHSYAILAAVCLVWCAALVNALVAGHFSPAAFVRARWPGLAAAILLTAVAGFGVATMVIESLAFVIPSLPVKVTW